MKIRRLYEKKKPYRDEYYVIQIMIGDEIYNIPADESEFETNYDAHDLDDVVRFYIEQIEDPDAPKNTYRILKVTEEEVEDEKIDMLIKAKKYNL